MVEYPVLRKMATKKPHYRDYATLLELAVIADDAPKANFYLKKVIATDLERGMDVYHYPEGSEDDRCLAQRGGQNQTVSTQLIEAVEDQLKNY